MNALELHGDPAGENGFSPENECIWMSETLCLENYSAIPPVKRQTESTLAIEYLLEVGLKEANYLYIQETLL